MARRLVLLAAGFFLAIVALFAFAWPEASLAFTGLGVGIVAGSWWLSPRLPSRSPSVRELRGAAVAALLLGIVAAVLIPSTTEACECPLPRGGIGGFGCIQCLNVDHHIGVRLAAALIGLIVSLALALAARSRSRTQLERVNPE